MTFGPARATSRPHRFRSRSSIVVLIASMPPELQDSVTTSICRNFSRLRRSVRDFRFRRCTVGLRGRPKADLRRVLHSDRRQAWPLSFKCPIFNTNWLCVAHALLRAAPSLLTAQSWTSANVLHNPQPRPQMPYCQRELASFVQIRYRPWRTHSRRRRTCRPKKAGQTAQFCTTRPPPRLLIANRNWLRSFKFDITPWRTHSCVPRRHS
jgi:hypothetical protein